MPDGQSLSDASADLKRTFEIYREYVKHQYDLTNHRTGWFATIQAFLFGTFGFSIQKYAELSRSSVSNSLISADSTARAQLELFMLIICVVGVFIATAVFILLDSARRPISMLAMDWEKKIGTEKIRNRCLRDELSTKGQLLLVGGFDRSAAWGGRVLTLVFPTAIALAWTCIALFVVLMRGTLRLDLDLLISTQNWIWVALTVLPLFGVLVLLLRSMLWNRRY